MANHLIDTIEIDVGAPDHRLATELQNRVGRLVAYDIPSLLEHVFDKHDRPESTVRIEHLELQLGRVEPDELEEQLLERLSTELDRMLGDLLARSRKTSSGGLHQTDAGVRRLSSDDAKLTELTVFLRTGVLPWSANPEEYEELDAVVETLLHRSPARVLSVLEEITFFRPARKRLLDNLGLATLDRVVAPLLGLSLGSLRRLRTTLRRYLRVWASAGFPRQLPVLCFGPLLYAPALFRDAGDNVETLLQTWLEVAFELLLNEDGANWGGFLAAAAGTLPEVEPLGDAAAHTVVSSFPASHTRRITRPPGDERDNADASKSAQQNRPLRSQSESVADVQPELGPDLESGAAWAMRNAGLVILWPYVERYLTHIGLAVDGTFANSELQLRAAHALQRLVVGPREYHEYDLVLNKVLCGLRIEAPIGPDEAAREHHENRSELLQKVIDNWPGVGKMSVDGLRGSFLVRDGRVERIDRGWRLRIERKGYDVLLDHLTYSTSVLRLPWMSEVLFVEW